MKIARRVFKVVRYVSGVFFVLAGLGMCIKLVLDLITYEFFVIKGWTPYVWMWTEGGGNLVMYLTVIIFLFASGFFIIFFRNPKKETRKGNGLNE